MYDLQSLFLVVPQPTWPVIVIFHWPFHPKKIVSMQKRIFGNENDDMRNKKNARQHTVTSSWEFDSRLIKATIHRMWKSEKGKLRRYVFSPPLLQQKSCCLEKIRERNNQRSYASPVANLWTWWWLVFRVPKNSQTWTVCVSKNIFATQS